ncbi:MAG: Lrp/AsnC family transcriptional regulator [Candidatus Aenigmatarchaeota archaeon]
MVKLTQNEKRALKMLIENGRVSDTKIAKQLRVTKQAVGKIRRKLEESGIITGYSTQVDYGKVGINTFAVAVLKFNIKSWEEMGELGIERKITDLPHVIDVYRIPQGSATHIALCGFRSLTELDEYFHTLKTSAAYNQYLEMKDIYIFSHHSLLKNTPAQLLQKVIDEMGKDLRPKLLELGEIDRFKNGLLKQL